MAAATPEIAIRTALLADATTAAITTRITPLEATQEPELPCVVMTRQGGTSSKKLGGGNKRKRYLIQLDCIAETDAQANALADAVDAVLDGYRNWTDGVDSAFTDDTDAAAVDVNTAPCTIVSRLVAITHSPTTEG